MIAPESELLRIAGINQMIQSISSIAGPALGTLAITLMSIGNVLLLDIIGAVVAIVALLLVYIPNPEIPEKAKASFAQAWNDLKVGFKAILDNKGLTWLFAYSTVGLFCIMPVAVLFPLLTLQYFGGGKWEMSIIEMVWGIGMLVGGSVLGIFKPNIRKVVMINAVNIVLGISLALSGIIPSHTFWIFVGLTTIGGMAATIYNASFMTVLQEEIRPEVMGRVFSLYFSIAVIPSVIGLLGTGWAADFFGVNNIFIVLGCAVALNGVFPFFNRAVMALGRKD